VHATHHKKRVARHSLERLPGHPLPKEQYPMNPKGYDSETPTRRTLTGKRVPIVFRKERTGWLGLGPAVTVTDQVIYDGVPANVKARRRAAGKVAKQSRKINRGRR
jgi:hypothetical protein